MLKGFARLATVKELKNESFNWENAPMVGGVYIVVRKNQGRPKFLEEGTGGFFKGKNPNVSTEILNKKWVDFKPSETKILYIGKAGRKNSKVTLKHRIKLYIRFGNKEPVAHWGGRYIWQLEDSDNLEIYWKKDDDPRQEEKKLLSEFKNNHDPKLPFANLKM